MSLPECEWRENKEGHHLCQKSIVAICPMVFVEQLLVSCEGIPMHCKDILETELCPEGWR